MYSVQKYTCITDNQEGEKEGKRRDRRRDRDGDTTNYSRRVDVVVVSFHRRVVVSVLFVVVNFFVQ